MFLSFFFFFFNDTAPTEIYTLSLHDALPICGPGLRPPSPRSRVAGDAKRGSAPQERKSTRLNSSHRCISYAVFCLKKKKKTSRNTTSHMKTKTRSRSKRYRSDASQHMMQSKR